MRIFSKTRQTPQWFCLLFAATVSLCLTLQACSQSANQKTQLLLTGSSTVAPLIAEIAEQYEQNHPEVTIEVKTGGSNQGIEDVRSGKNDIGMISRSPKAEEEDLQVFTIAQDGIGLIVHQSVPIERLERQTVIDIFTGKITSWKALGGADRPIEVLSKTSNHSTVGLFADYFGLDVEDIQPTHFIGDNTEILETVLENPDAIGYISIGAGEYSIVHGMPLKMLPLEGVAATIKQVSQGNFPLSRPLNLLTKELPSGLTKDFIDFAISPDVHDIIERQAFIPAA
ncbi:MAG: phosphate ABC transporter substrate-binding protein [Cyanobacteria bacterium J06621_11]